MPKPVGTRKAGVSYSPPKDANDQDVSLVNTVQSLEIEPSPASPTDGKPPLRFPLRAVAYFLPDGQEAHD